MSDETTGSNPGASTETTSSGGGSGVPASTGAPAAPQVYDMSDDALIRIKGSDKPVKFGEHVRGFQSQFTKASQEAARLKRELQARDQRIQEIERAQQAQRTQGPASDPFEDLRKLPYLSGESAVEVIQSIGEQFKQRDQLLMATLKQLQQMKGVVDTLNGSHSNASFEQKISRFLQQGGYDPAYRDFAKELYLAYEGDNLDDEFPQNPLQPH